MSMRNLDTHYYDGKLKNYFDYVISKIEYVPISFDITISEMKDYCKNNNLNDAYNTLTLLESKKGNYDPTDNINSELLLNYIWYKIKHNPNEYMYIFEQLGDITTSGPCPQGRSKRLFQVIKSLYD